MISQTSSFSSNDGLIWTQHAKTDPGSRLSANYTFFDDKLWMFGGMKVPLTAYADVVASDFHRDLHSDGPPLLRTWATGAHPATFILAVILSTIMSVCVLKIRRP